MVEAAGAGSTTGSGTREEIKENVMKLVTTHLEAADTYNSIAEDKTMNMKTTMGVHEGINVTVMKCHAKGLTVEDFKEFYAPGAMFANVTKVDKIITGRQLEDFEGFPMLY